MIRDAAKEDAQEDDKLLRLLISSILSICLSGYLWDDFG